MNQTIQNLTKAFIGESQARNRYSFYAKVAMKEGYEQIAEIFTVTAENERIHAKRLFETINKLKKNDQEIDTITIETEAPTAYGTTIDNLKAAIAGEHHEHSSMYPEFAEIAQNEGYPEIAARLRAIAIAEEHHEERYKKLLKEVEAGTVFKKKKETWWVCRECGYMHFGKEPPVKCPACDHPTAFYQVKCEEY
jgi:rubrerythrin